MFAAGCPRCGGAVALHEGRPVVTGVTGTGAVELWHRVCFERQQAAAEHAARAAAAAEHAPAPAPAPAPRVRPQWPALVAIGAVAMTGVVLRVARADIATSTVTNVEVEPVEAVEVSAALARPEAAPPPVVETPLEARFPIPDLDGERLDRVFSSLAGWTHPVTASAELLPSLRSRLFGSERAGIERAECGDGHCGVDLDGPRGRPIVAVADGVVVRVERKELGSDGRSGRYVRLQHEDGALTAYMHLDDVADDLQVGDRVFAGQYVGTLGATAVYAAPPHLHFSLEVPRDPDDRGDLTNTRYVDPAPFLVRATIAKAAERRHAVKPAF